MGKITENDVKIYLEIYILFVEFLLIILCCTLLDICTVLDLMMTFLCATDGCSSGLLRYMRLC